LTAENDKSPSAYRTISEVAESMNLPQHVLRFWETRFPQIKPLKRGGGRRYYRPEDVELLKAIRRLLYDNGYTIKGVQRMLRELGATAVIASEGKVADKMTPPAPSPAARIEAIPADPAVHDDPVIEEEAANDPGGLGASDIAALRAALGDIREAQRQLAQSRGS
jgi:DNA-binding transcriptional MerR regulator